MIRNRALVTLCALSLAGCAGGSHAAQEAQAPPEATVQAMQESAQATPFGVASPAATAAAGAPAVASSEPVRSVRPTRAARPASGIGLPAAAAVAASSPPSAVAATPLATSAPRIISVRTSPPVVHDGDTLLWNVRTTPDVVDVVAHVTVYAFRLQKQGTGQYVLTFTIPHGVPGFFHGTYTLDLVARSVSGVQTTTKVPVSFQ